MGTLVAACEACRDAAVAYGIPFISGKDSLHNQFTNSETGEVLRIPNTLLISAMAIVDDVRRVVTMDLKKPGDGVYLVRPTMTAPALADLAHVHRTVAGAIAAGHVVAVHDVTEGGAAVALAEMAIASGLGLDVTAGDAGLFDESAARYLLEIPAGDEAAVKRHFEQAGVSMTPVAKVTTEAKAFDIDVAELTKTWRGTLDW
jgi:phosphoribosylformylglycinamidine synthase